MKHASKTNLFIFYLAFSFSAAAQGLKLYKKSPIASDTAIREFTKNISLPDASTVFVGQADEGPEANFSLTKIDTEGNIIWQKVLLHQGIDAVNNFCLTSDGGFAIVGWTDGQDGLYIDAIVVKTNSIGDVEWAKRISSPDDDEAFGVAALDNGDILVAGASFAGLGSRNGFACRLDSEGNEIWSNAYKQGNFNAFRTVIPMPEAGALLCGYSWKTGSNSTLFDPFFVRVDSLGNIIWAKRKKQSGSQVLYDFEKDIDGGIIYGGVTSTTGSNQNVIGKISSSGDHIWAKTFGTPNGDRIWDLAITGAGDIIAAGFTDKNNTANTRRNGFISRIDNAGTILESVAFGASDTNSTTFTGLSLSGNYLMANALTYAFGNPSGAGLVARLSTFSLLNNCQGNTLTMTSANLATTDSTGGQNADPPLISDEAGFSAETNDLVMQTICSYVSAGEKVKEEPIRVQPNPSKEGFLIHIPGGKKKTIRIFSMQGSLLQSFESLEESLKISLQDQPVGLYKLQIMTGETRYSVTLVKE